MRQKGFSVYILLILASLILATCSGSTTTPSDDATTTSAPAATAAPGSAAATNNSAAAVAPGYSIKPPQGLRTDLKGMQISAVLGAEGPGRPFDNAAIAKFTEATGIIVNYIPGPRSATDRLAQYLQEWDAQSPDIDVYMIDVIWPSIAAPYAFDLKPAFSSSINNYFPAIVQNNTINNKLVGVPWYTDAGLLYYRTDLLEKYGFHAPPTTWTELEQMAEKIQDGEREAGNNDFYGFVWQGKAYEGLTCDALEWQVSNGGGLIIESDGRISVNNPQTIAALQRAKNWIERISPESVTTYGERESLDVFTSGNAAFMRNWPYAYAVSNTADSKIKGKIAVTLLPKGDGAQARNAATLGGWQLMVSNYSQKKDAAIEFVKFMTSPEIQRFYAIERALPPTIASVYDDPDVLRINPYYKDLKPVFQGGAVPRPSTVSGELYNYVSTAYFTTVNKVLTGQTDPTMAVAELETQLKDIMAQK